MQRLSLRVSALNNLEYSAYIEAYTGDQPNNLDIAIVKTPANLNLFPK